MKIRLTVIAEQTLGILSGSDLDISGFSIDTRTLCPGDLYIAIKGQHFDGHQFVKEAIKKGAKAVLVHCQQPLDVPQIVVKDTRLALAEIAQVWKNKAQVTTLAITGSNGKTTVKEMVAAILATGANTLSTQGNLNNDIGVPLTLLRLNQSHQYAVIEMGANHAGEIAYSCHYAEPDIALITNVGQAHIEGFGNLEMTAKAKAEIIQGLDQTGIVILNRDDAFYALWRAIADQRQVVSFGIDHPADIKATGITAVWDKDAFITRFNLSTPQGRIDIKLNLAGLHNVMNALAAAAMSFALGFDLTHIKLGLEQLQPITGRLQPLLGLRGYRLINDSYNANPDSFKPALEVLIQCTGIPWVIFGALGEMGQDSPAIHQQLGKLIKSKGVIRLLAIGNDAIYTVRGFGEGATFFDSPAQLITTLKQTLTGQEVLLIKGSRAQKLENIVTALTNDNPSQGL